MRFVRNCLVDPSLHLLGIALILVYLAFGDRSKPRASDPDEPLAFCAKCRIHHLPERPCSCEASPKVAQARP